jgi:hypothetical protein
MPSTVKNLVAPWAPKKVKTAESRLRPDSWKLIRRSLLFFEPEMSFTNLRTATGPKNRMNQ